MVSPQAGTPGSGASGTAVAEDAELPGSRTGTGRGEPTIRGPVGDSPTGDGPTGDEPSGEESTGDRPGRWSGRRAWSWLVFTVVVGLALAGPVVLLAGYLPRPFWYDEIWRGHFVSEPLSSLWSELAVANTPSAFGWLAAVRFCGDVLGWHSWALRLPGFLALPALGVALALLVRGFAGTLTAGFAVSWLCLCATFLDFASQLKPYTVEALVTVVVLLLWVGPGRGDIRGRATRRTVAGLVALCSVPAVFVLLPLAAADVLGRGAGRRRRRALEALPAVVLVAAHTLLFLRHQSAQRGGTYWDTQFLAGRDPWAALVFVADQLWLTITGSPPGVDRFDPSVVPGYVHLPEFLPWLLVPMIVGCGAVGVAALARRADGRRVLAAVAGAEVLMLAASAVRFWPFGPTRTNQFVVPLLLLFVVVGADRVIRHVIRYARTAWVATVTEALPATDEVSATSGVREAGRVRGADIRGESGGCGDGARGLGSRLAPVVGAVAVVLVTTLAGGVALAGAVAGDEILWERRDRLRGLDLMVDAAVATRRLAGPDDVVVVGGRLARPGWIYAMEVSADAPRGPAALPPVPAVTRAGDEAPRVARSRTVFVDAGRLDSTDGPAELTAELLGARRPARLVVFVLDIEEKSMAPVLAAFRGDGWCAGERWSLTLTGSVTVYERCPT